MIRWDIINGADRLGFATSLVAGIDGIPKPGYLSRPESRGGDVVPSNLGEWFIVKNDKGEELPVQLIILGARKKGWDGTRVTFEAVLWAACDEHRRLIVDPTDPWVYFRGEYNFQTFSGYAERVQQLPPCT